MAGPNADPPSDAAPASTPAQPPPAQANGSRDRSANAAESGAAIAPRRHENWGARSVECYEKLEQVGEGTYGQVRATTRARRGRPVRGGGLSEGDVPRGRVAIDELASRRARG